MFRSLKHSNARMAVPIGMLPSHATPVLLPLVLDGVGTDADEVVVPVPDLHVHRSGEQRAILALLAEHGGSLAVCARLDLVERAEDLVLSLAPVVRQDRVRDGDAVPGFFLGRIEPDALERGRLRTARPVDDLEGHEVRATDRAWVTPLR